MKSIFLLVVVICISCAAHAQFYIGCDSLIWTKSQGYHTAPNSLIGKMELYQDSIANKLLLVSNLKDKKVIHPMSYRVMDDSETGQPYLLLTRYETINIKLTLQQQINVLTKYRSFKKVSSLSNTDSEYVATAEETNDGIDGLEDIWRVTDRDIPCELSVDFTYNNPRHSTVYYYYLDLGASCIDSKTVSKCKKCPVE